MFGHVVFKLVVYVADSFFLAAVTVVAPIMLILVNLDLQKNFLFGVEEYQVGPVACARTAMEHGVVVEGKRQTFLQLSDVLQFDSFFLDIVVRAARAAHVCAHVFSYPPTVVAVAYVAGQVPHVMDIAHMLL